MSCHASRRQQGTGLVEVMVAIIVGMLITLLIYQVFSGFESQRRVTVGSATAQQSGVLALHAMTRVMAMAGWGQVGGGGPQCTQFYTYDAATSQPWPSVSVWPVTIADGGLRSGSGSSLPDAITINSGSSVRASAPAMLQKTMSAPLESLFVNSAVGYATGDLVWVSEGSQCTLMQLSVVDTFALRLAHQPGSAAPYNPTAAYASANGWPRYSNNARIFNTGRMTITTYGISGSDLVADIGTGGSAATRIEVAAEVINLQAQYGLSTQANTLPITSWVDATGATAATLGRVRAIRLAVLSRSTEARRPDLANRCAAPVVPLPWPGAPPFDLGGNADVACYRYRVFQTVVPLRNVLWAAS